jgi:hypothetical protein
MGIIGFVISLEHERSGLLLGIFVGVSCHGILDNSNVPARCRH